MSIRPSASTATQRRASEPRPAMSIALAMQLCARRTRRPRSPAPAEPRPACASPGPGRRARATSKAIRLAMEAPVTNRPPAPAGKSNSSAIHRATWRSTSTGIWSRPPRLAFSPAASISARAPGHIAPAVHPAEEPGMGVADSVGQHRPQKVLVHRLQGLGRARQGRQKPRAPRAARAARPGPRPPTGCGRACRPACGAPGREGPASPWDRDRGRG